MSGFVHYPCKGETLIPIAEGEGKHPSGTGIALGESGYIVRGLHYKLTQVPHPKKEGFTVPGPVGSDYCLERIHDGKLVDVDSSAVLANAEVLNAMEVLARVKQKG